VYAAFRTILQEDELYVNIAGAGAHRPTRKVPFKPEDIGKLQKQGVDTSSASNEVRGSGKNQTLLIDRPDWISKEGKKWLHWDMNPFTGAISTATWAVQDVDKNREYRLRVQGFLAVTDGKADNGGFFCVPGAHKLIRKWAKHHSEDSAMRNRVLEPFTNARYYIPANDPMIDAGQEIAVRAGSLVIWNSALPHSNYPNRSSEFRMVQYLTMTSAKDGDFAPLFTDIELVRPVPEYSFSKLGHRLHGFEPWVMGDVLDKPYDSDDDGSVGGGGSKSDPELEPVKVISEGF